MCLWTCTKPDLENNVLLTSWVKLMLNFHMIWHAVVDNFIYRMYNKNRESTKLWCKHCLVQDLSDLIWSKASWLPVFLVCMTVGSELQRFTAQDAFHAFQAWSFLVIYRDGSWLGYYHVYCWQWMTISHFALTSMHSWVTHWVKGPPSQWWWGCS